MIEVQDVRHPVTGFGCDFDDATAFADGDDDVVVVVVRDDYASECRAAMNVAYLRFSLHVRPVNCHPAMHRMATKSDCMQPTMDMCRPLIVTVACWHTIANSFQRGSMRDLVYCL